MYHDVRGVLVIVDLRFRQEDELVGERVKLFRLVVEDAVVDGYQVGFRAAEAARHYRSDKGQDFQKVFVLQGRLKLLNHDTE